MSRLPYTLTATSLMVVLDNRPRVLKSGSPNFDKVRAMLVLPDHDIGALRDMLDIPSFIAKQTFGRVKIGMHPSGSYGVIFDGDTVPNQVLVDRLVAAALAGEDVEPVARFVDRLMDNPSEESRNELFLWLEVGMTPICPDGRFLAYKRVRSDYKDIHSGTIDNSVGMKPFMKREDVDPNRRNECSRGLHFCAAGYLSHFGSNGSGDHIMILAIDPADVVSIPQDYSNQKGRTWRYEVVGEVPLDEVLVTDLGIIARNVVDQTETADWGDDTEDPNNTLVSESEPDEDGDIAGGEDNAEEMVFSLNGDSFTEDFILEEVSEYGQRGASRRMGVPRTTIQNWMKRIAESKLGD